MKKLGKARKIKRTGKELTFEIKFTKAGYKFLIKELLWKTGKLYLSVIF